jgi:signal transduction histidine kinase
MGLFGIMFLTRTISQPLHELLKGIRFITAGAQGRSVRVYSEDEFGELARAFNEMSSRLNAEERMRSDFISMLSHEVRTPLTSIRESVNLIAEEVMGPINDRQKRFLEIASQEIERITQLLKHLMQVSRLEAGLLQIERRPIEIAEFIAGSLVRLMPAAEAKNIVMRSELSSQVESIFGDRDHLQQVLLNLLGNAIKFSPPGSEVVVRVSPDRDRDMIGFSVSDQGPGIPEQEQELVFHKYYRAPGVRDQVDGVGLGLSISKHIVEAHGGTVWVRSRVGEGSVFGFSLPAGSLLAAARDGENE